MPFFAYATMMDTAIMRKTCPSAAPIGTATLHGFRADFFRRSRAWEGGGCLGIVPDGAGVVRGVLFEIDEADLARLEDLETGASYRCVDVRVRDAAGAEVEAFTYEVEPEGGGPYPPRGDYLAAMQAGAAEHGMPEHGEALAALAARAEVPHVHPPPRAVPVARDVDVLVVGGGCAGVVAALAAARQGARTVLVERNSFLGGDVCALATGLHSFYNTYLHEPVTEKVQVVGGIPWEIAGRLVEAEGSLGHIDLEKGGKYLSVLTPVDPEVFKQVAFRMCADAGVELLLHTVATDAIVEDGVVRGVVVESKSGREALLARAVVDCSGDADVAGRAGAPHTHRKGPENWGVSLTFRLVNVDLDPAAEQIGARDNVFQLARARRIGDDGPRVCRLAVDMNAAWAEAVARWRVRGRFLATSIRRGEATQMNCTMFGPLDPLSRDDLTRAELALRDEMHRVVGFLRENIDGFGGCYPVWTAAGASVRRSRVVHTRYELTVDDLTAGRQFDDAIGLFGLVDDKQTFIEGNRWYGIPYRSLLPQAVEGLLVAGRCIGRDDRVHSSTRMVAHCMVQGQAAGTAAAMAALADQHPSALDALSLREALMFEDVILEV